MGPAEISIDKEATIANAHAHLQYASDLRQGATNHAAAIGDAVNSLGDLYADYKDAVNQSLIPEFLGAHYRLANLHEAHGYRDLDTVQIFTDQDEAGAAGIAQGMPGATPPNEIAT
jgi:hypothetical protein